MSIAHYRKTVVALFGGVLAWAQVAYVPDGHIDRGEYYGLAVALATALGVYGVTNRVNGAPGDAWDDRWGPTDPATDAAPESVVQPSPASIWPVQVLDAPPGTAQPVPTDVPTPAAGSSPHDGGI